MTNKKARVATVEEFKARYGAFLIGDLFGAFVKRSPRFEGDRDLALRLAAAISDLEEALDAEGCALLEGRRPSQIIAKAFEAASEVAVPGGTETRGSAFPAAASAHYTVTGDDVVPTTRASTPPARSGSPMSEREMEAVHRIGMEFFKEHGAKFTAQVAAERGLAERDISWIFGQVCLHIAVSFYHQAGAGVEALFESVRKTWQLNARRSQGGLS